MGIRDQRIDWIRKRLWIPPFYMQGVALIAEDDDTLESLVDADVDYIEIGTLGYGSVSMADGKLLAGYIPCPYDVDPNYPIGYRIAFTIDHDGAGNADASWILLTGIEKKGQALSAAATALDTAIAVPTAYTDENGAITSTTDFLLQWTARGIDNLIGLTRDNIEDGAFLTYKIEMDAATNETTVRYIGLEMDYVPMKTQGEGSHIDKPLKTSGVS